MDFSTDFERGLEGQDIDSFGSYCGRPKQRERKQGTAKMLESHWSIKTRTKQKKEQGLILQRIEFRSSFSIGKKIAWLVYKGRKATLAFPTDGCPM